MNLEVAKISGRDINLKEVEASDSDINLDCGTIPVLA
jgi:hypothetical protein